MNERKWLDYFESEFYNNAGDYVKNFMTHDFIIGEITFANIVRAGTGTKTHKNRKCHGLAFSPVVKEPFISIAKKSRSEKTRSYISPKAPTTQ
jgi:hypothetical protein